MNEFSIFKTSENSIIEYLASTFHDVSFYFLIFNIQGKILKMNKKLKNMLEIRKKIEDSLQIEDIVNYNNKVLKKKHRLKFIEDIETSKNLIEFSFSYKKHQIPVKGCRLRFENIKNLDQTCIQNLRIILAYDIQPIRDLQKELTNLKEEFNRTLLNFPELKLWSITQKKEPLELIDKSVEALRLKEKKYQKIVESIREGYFELDLEGKILFINNGFCNLTGFSKSELIGKTYEHLLLEKFNSNIDDIIEEGMIEDTYEFQLKKKDNSLITVETSLVKKESSEGEHEGYFGLIRDVSEKKKAQLLEMEFRERLENEVKKRTSELQEAIELQKKYMNEIIRGSQFKSQFLATFSHELRTPLNVIIGFTDLLLEKSYGELTNEQQSFLSDIKDSSNHLLKMIKNILYISKIELGEKRIHKKKIDLNAFITQIQSSLMPLVEAKNLQLLVDLENSPKEIYTDPLVLKEILFNVLGNAIKFTFEGSITLKISSNDRYWLFQIIDTGIGIETKDYEKVFKEFVRIENDETKHIEGTGLGLPITKNLVNLIGGNISFISKIEKGTIFTIKLLKSYSDLQKIDK